MKVTMNTTLATPTACYVQGQDYELDDAEARRLIDAGQATDPEGKVKPRPPERQVMDAQTGKPVERVITNTQRTTGPTASGPLQGTADAGKNQTAASVEGAATDAKVQHPIGAQAAGVVATAAPAGARVVTSDAQSAPAAEASGKSAAASSSKRSGGAKGGAGKKGK